MRFAVTAISAGVLGLAAALLVACGNGNGLLSSDEAGSLGNALAGVESACASGQLDAAERHAQQFRDEVSALSPDVDARLTRNLARGASTLEELVPQTCTAATETLQTESTPATTPTEPETPTTAPPPETTTTPVEPPATTPTEPPSGTEPPPSNGGGETPPDNGGGTSGSSGGSGTPGSSGNQGNQGGQGGSDNQGGGVGSGGAQPGQGTGP